VGFLNRKLDERETYLHGNVSRYRPSLPDWSQFRPDGGMELRVSYGEDARPVSVDPEVKDGCSAVG
jgi:hypothetical protein